jgi:hypothetical protein
MPVNGSHEFASSVPTAARVASTAAAGGGMSVSRFSMRSISGSLPAAAATVSIENPGMPFSRSPMGRPYPGSGCHALPVGRPRRPCGSSRGYQWPSVERVPSWATTAASNRSASRPAGAILSRARRPGAGSTRGRDQELGGSPDGRAPSAPRPVRERLQARRECCNNDESGAPRRRVRRLAHRRNGRAPSALDRPPRTPAPPGRSRCLYEIDPCRRRSSAARATGVRVKTLACRATSGAERPRAFRCVTVPTRPKGGPGGVIESRAAVGR